MTNVPHARNALSGFDVDERERMQPINVADILAGRFHNEAQWVIDPPSASAHEARSWTARAHEAFDRFESDCRMGEGNPEGTYLRALINQIHTVLSSTKIYVGKSDIVDMSERLKFLLRANRERSLPSLNRDERHVAEEMIAVLEIFLADMSHGHQRKVVDTALLCALALRAHEPSDE